MPSESVDVNLRPPTSQPKPGPRQPGSPMGSPRRPKEALQLPRTPSNDIFVATSSMDGNVCVQSLLDVKDVHLRNFARPVQAIALSPEYKTDRTYLSGGLAGQLILTVGGGTGRSTSTTTGTAAAAASGWLGSMGIGNSGGKDTVLHAGEGSVGCIKWSLSGKYACWLNEYGIKFMRTNLQLDADHSEGAWRRIGHYDRPETEEWETMASVWKGRMEWIDEKSVMSDDSTGLDLDSARPPVSALRKQTYERLLVGWGGTVWIIHVHPDGKGDGKKGTDKPYGSPELANM